MKKALVVVVMVSVLLLTGCFSSKLEPATSEKVLEYTRSSNYGTLEDTKNYYFITVYANKKIVSGRINDTEYKEKTLTDKEYQEVMDLAFTSSFKNMGSDISDNSIMDGSSQYITLYYADGTTFKTGGLNPTKKEFTKVANKLEELVK